ncbi:hypothetical protein LguiA_022011 [Lonicera macranthoides]
MARKHMNLELNSHNSHTIQASTSYTNRSLPRAMARTSLSRVSAPALRLGVPWRLFFDISSCYSFPFGDGPPARLVACNRHLLDINRRLSNYKNILLQGCPPHNKSLFQHNRRLWIYLDNKLSKEYRDGINSFMEVDNLVVLLYLRVLFMRSWSFDSFRFWRLPADVAGRVRMRSQWEKCVPNKGPKAKVHALMGIKPYSGLRRGLSLNLRMDYGLLSSVIPLGIKMTAQYINLLEHIHQEFTKQDYIDALYNFFNERKPELFVCPKTSNYKRFSDQDDDGAAPLHGNLTRPQKMTSDDILRDLVPYNQQETMRNFCYQALKMNVKSSTDNYGYLWSSEVLVSYPRRPNKVPAKLLKNGICRGESDETVTLNGDSFGLRMKKGLCSLFRDLRLFHDNGHFRSLKESGFSHNLFLSEMRNLFKSYQTCRLKIHLPTSILKRRPRQAKFYKPIFLFFLSYRTNHLTNLSEFVWQK